MINNNETNERFEWKQGVRPMEISALTLSGRLHGLPEEFALGQNYPNPFNPATTIELALPQACDWNLEIYNILGQRVREFRGKNEAGYINLTWTADNQASGVYFYRLKAGDFVETKKMLLLK